MYKVRSFRTRRDILSPIAFVTKGYLQLRKNKMYKDTKGTAFVTRGYLQISFNSCDLICHRLFFVDCLTSDTIAGRWCVGALVLGGCECH